METYVMTNASKPELHPGKLSLLWRRFSGPAADEIHIHCRPDSSRPGDIARQAASAYEALASLLGAREGSLEHLVRQIVFFRNIRKDYEPFRQALHRVFGAHETGRPPFPASTHIEQPPLDSRVDLEISAVAVIPREGSVRMPGDLHAGRGRAFVLGEQVHLCAECSGIPGTAFDETVTMFCAAERMLQEQGMSFHDVVRTWIYLRHMERDYAEFNRGRREFFRQRNITLLPASTGIYGSPCQEQANLALSFQAIRCRKPLQAAAMTTPTLNEACTYGSDFSRGLRVVEGNKLAFYISGTASVDEYGRTAHVDDFDAQVDRMLLNVDTLLSAQGASFKDMLSAITYLKSADDAPRLRRILRDRGLDDIPNALVQAAVCRPDLLCEMEAIAALPLP